MERDLCYSRKESEEAMIVCGCDLSKRHFALIMKDMKSGDYHCYVGWQSLPSIKKWKKSCPEYTFYYLPKKGKGECQDHYDMEAGKTLREAVSISISNFVIRTGGKYPVLIALEGYAYGGDQVIGLAEITRPVKEMMYDAGCAIRIHDPLSLKMWAGGGNFSKEQVLNEARKDVNFPDVLCQGSNNPGFDLADALYLKTMLEWEVKVRSDPSYMRRLNEKQIQVFNRVTRGNPVNLLNRPFLAIEQPKIKRSKG